jgi:hypothetical protein
LAAWASRDANCGIFAASTAVGGTVFCAQAGSTASAASRIIAAHEMVLTIEI